jgi:hypothetical protein
LVVPDTSAAVAAQPAGMRKSAIKRPGQGGNAPNERELVVMEPEYKFTPRLSRFFCGWESAGAHPVTAPGSHQPDAKYLRLPSLLSRLPLLRNIYGTC